MKKYVVPLTALLIGSLAALAAYNVLQKIGSRETPHAALTQIGDVTEVAGEVSHRLPRAIGLEPLSGAGPLFSQELLHTGKASKAVLSLKSGTSLELRENSELVVELDPAKPDALLGTLLGGEAELLNPGEKGLFRLFKNGREIDPAKAATPDIPVIAPEPGAMPAAPVVASTPDESEMPAATPLPVQAKPRTLPPAKGTPRMVDTLSNDEIKRGLKAQTAYFQRCYLTFINRNRSARSGSLSVTFKILPSGKTTGVRIVKSGFKDATLKKCVVDVIERTPFRAFQSDAINIREFPITLQ